MFSKKDIEAIVKKFERLIASEGIRSEEIKAEIDLDKRVIRFYLTKQHLDIRFDDFEREVDEELAELKKMAQSEDRRRKGLALRNLRNFRDIGSFLID